MSDAVFEGSGFRLEHAPAGHVLQVLSRVLRADLSGRLQAVAEPASLAVRRAGPESWWLVGAQKLGAAEVAQHGAAIADVGWLIDQTHGRSRFILSGPASVRRQARGIGADLGALAVGASMETQYAAIGILLTRAGAESFEILVGRSFADSLWGELTRG